MDLEGGNEKLDFNQSPDAGTSGAMPAAPHGDEGQLSIPEHKATSNRKSVLRILA